MPANDGAAQWLRSSGTRAIVVLIAGSTDASINVVVGTVTEVHGQLVHNEEHPHGAPSGHPSSLQSSLHAAATSALTIEVTPLIVASKATTKRA